MQLHVKRSPLRRIGILTGGGDCPGLNAVLRAVTKTAIHDYDLEVFGIEDGYEGLMTKRGRFLSSDDVSGILTHGGTILGTSNRSNPFRVPVTHGRRIEFVDQSQHAMRHFEEWELDGLIVVGGDGTLSIAQELSQKGIPIIGIPKTIDNDLAGTDFTFGFHTAVMIATEALDRLHTTAASHHRVMIMEVMGRHVGWIALFAGSAGGADIILIPEIPYQMKVISSEVEKRVGKGRRFSLVVVAEGALEEGGRPFVRKKDKKNPYPEKLGGVGNFLADKIEKMTGIETRAAILGHIQRGGSPTPFDRNLGTLFGKVAVDCLVQKKWAHMVCLKGQEIRALPIGKAIQIKRVPLSHPLVRSVESLGNSFGRAR